MPKVTMIHESVHGLAYSQKNNNIICIKMKIRLAQRIQSSITLYR